MSATTGMLRSALGYAPWAIGLGLIGVGIGFGRDKLNQRSAETQLQERWSELETCLVGPRGYQSDGFGDPQETFRRIAMSPNPAVRDASPHGWPSRCRPFAQGVVTALGTLPRNEKRDALRTSIDTALPRFGGIEAYDDIALIFGHARALSLEGGWSSVDAAPSPYYANAPEPFPGRLRAPIENVVRERHTVILEGESPRMCQVFDHSPTLDCVPMAKDVIPRGAFYQTDHADAYARFTLIVPTDQGHAVVDGATGARLADNVSPENVYVPSIAPGDPLPIHFLRRGELGDSALLRTTSGKTDVLVPSFKRTGKAGDAVDLSSATLVGSSVWSKGTKGWETQSAAPFLKKLTLLGDAVKAADRMTMAHHRCAHGGETIVVTGTDDAPTVVFGREGAWSVVRSAQPIAFASSSKVPKTIRCREKVVDITWLERVPLELGDRFPSVLPRRVLCDREGCVASNGEAVMLYGAGQVVMKDGVATRTVDDDATLVALADGNMLLVWWTPLLGVRARIGHIARLGVANDEILSDRKVNSLHTFGSGEHVTVLFSDDVATSGVRVASSGLVTPLTESSFASKVPE